MGDILGFDPRRRAHPRRVVDPRPTTTAEIAFFTGVRIERWADRSSERRDDPSGPEPKSPRGRRRARPGP